MKIITVTLNPAFDIHCYLDRFEPFGENYINRYEISAGGKGVNISRALCVNGIKNTALIVTGKENKPAFCHEIEKCGMEYRAFDTEGRIRENITLHSAAEPETRLSFEGFSLPEGILEKIYSAVSPDSDTILAFAGRIPAGLDKKLVFAFLKKIQSSGVKLAVDSNSLTIDDLILIRPWLIKPNTQEAQAIGYSVKTPGEGLEAAEKLHEYGIENVIISMGSSGGVFAGNAGKYIITVPKINAVSTIGAGDSTIAGFIAAFNAGKATDEILCEAFSWGTAACLTSGTNPPRPPDIAKIRNEVRVCVQ